MAPYPRTRRLSGPNYMRKVPARQPWKPPVAWEPPPPPAGYYDPALDAQERAVDRGYRDVVFDAGLATGRNQQDTDYSLGGLKQSHDRGVFDLTRQRDRGLEDIGRSRTRGTEDHNRQVQMLQRAFQQLGNRQGQQQRKYGVASGGAVLQAARKRAENEALERQPLDTGFRRMGEDLDQATVRLGQDFDTGRSRFAEDWGRESGRLGQVGGRVGEDTTLGVYRAGRERTESGLDIDAIRRYQAVGAGWNPGAPPPGGVGPVDAYRRVRPRSIYGGRRRG